jgi:hypothetical protein
VRFPFTPEARAQLRAIDRTAALRILESIAHFGELASGDVEPMHGEWQRRTTAARYAGFEPHPNLAGC